MYNDIDKRVLDEAFDILKTDKTIRQIAKISGVSKSTVHKDLHDTLENIDKDIFEKVNKVMENHIKIRHIRGGESTRKKYEKIKKMNNFTINKK